MENIILVGTSKGLVVFQYRDGQKAEIEIHFKGFPVSMIYVDKQTNHWWVALSHKHWGEKLYTSVDQGVNWGAVNVPNFHGREYRAGTPASLAKIWSMRRADENKNSFWVGTEPGGLFLTEDGGKTFQLNEGLWNHPSRKDDNQWFGTGKDFPFIHSIIVDPSNQRHLYVAVSCAGVFETEDGGNSWTPRNDGLIATYLPNKTPQVGHDPHQMLMCSANPQIIWQQNHCGIFRTNDGAKTWQKAEGNILAQLGSEKEVAYGFALAIDDQNSDVAWVIPAESDEARVPVDLRLQVFQTKDGGKTWTSKSNGLPKENAFDLVLRHGFNRTENLMAFGTTNGNLYCSFDDGENWQTVAQNLAPITTVAIV